MEFRTALDIPKSPLSLGIADSVVTLGSCFATSIGERLVTEKFNCLVNPFGTTYHPLAMHNLIRLAGHLQSPAPDGFVERDGTWYHYDFHSSFFDESREKLDTQLNERIKFVHHFLKKARVIILTYGTAWIYELRAGGRPVANCHKMPSALFTRRLATPHELVADFWSTFQAIRKSRADLRVILTVSPVRHVKDTLPLNQVSKSALRLACHQLQEEDPNLAYFPAYELMVDDLRDYRFYASDLIHPTPFAEEYIWEKFGAAYFTEETYRFLAQWEPLRQALLHRPRQPNGKAYREFLNSTLQQLERLRAYADVDQEIRTVREQLLHTEAR